MAANHHHKPKGLFGTGITEDDLHGLRFVGNDPEFYYKFRRSLELVVEAQNHINSARMMLGGRLNMNVQKMMVDTSDNLADIEEAIISAREG